MPRKVEVWQQPAQRLIQVVADVVHQRVPHRDLAAGFVVPRTLHEDLLGVGVSRRGVEDATVLQRPHRLFKRQTEGLTRLFRRQRRAETLELGPLLFIGRSGRAFGELREVARPERFIDLFDRLRSGELQYLVTDLRHELDQRRRVVVVDRLSKSTRTVTGVARGAFVELLELDAGRQVTTRNVAQGEVAGRFPAFDRHQQEQRRHRGDR